MVLKDTTHNMKKLLGELSRDLDKSGQGNKAASQRVRTTSIKFAKIAKMYRKESIASEKKNKKVGKVKKHKGGKKIAGGMRRSSRMSAKRA